MNRQEKINYVKTFLLVLDRPGIQNFINYLETSGFFTAPGSTRFHCNYEGGLLDHSFNLYEEFSFHLNKYKLQFNGSPLLTAIAHDACKIGAYINSFGGIQWNNSQPKGHCNLSLERVKQFIQLTKDEEECIKYHMGMYNTHEFGSKGEYTLMELSINFNSNKLTKLFYFCDDMVAQFVDKTKAELDNDKA